MFEMLHYAESLLQALLGLGDFFTTPFPIPVYELSIEAWLFNKNLFAPWQEVTLIELLISNGLPILLAWRVWRFVSDGIGL